MHLRPRIIKTEKNKDTRTGRGVAVNTEQDCDRIDPKGRL